MIDANKPKEAVFDQISSVIENVLSNTQAERDSMRQIYVFKIKQKLEEKKVVSVANVENEENNEGVDAEKSVEEAADNRDKTADSKLSRDRSI